jgi:hypothetical protein
MKGETENGVFHFIYVDEKNEKDDEKLKSLQANLKKLKEKAGIEEGFSSINKDFEETLDIVETKMFPWQSPSKVPTT